MNDNTPDLSWDIQRKSAPERPLVVSSIAEEQLIDRPKRVIVAFSLVAVAVLGFVVAAVVAVLQLDAIREALMSALPDDLVEDYSDEDLQQAVNIMLAAVGGLALLFTVVHTVSVRSFGARRNAAARIWFVVFVMLYVPVAFVSLIVRDGRIIDYVIVGFSLTCLIAAVIVVCTSRVSQWLRQNEQQRSIPIARLAQSTE